MEKNCKCIDIEKKWKLNDKDLLLKLTDFLMKENLITPDEKVRAAQVIKEVDKS